MGEIETLAQAEPLEEHIRRHSYDRLIMLSDGVFAIATTLAAIEVKLPDAPTLGAMLVAGKGQLAGYVLSFALTAVYWIQHRDLFARLQRVDQVLTIATLALLCFVALIPAAIHAIYEDGPEGAAFRFYVVLMALIGSVNFSMWAYAELRKGLLHPDVSLDFRLRRLVTTGTAPLILFPTLLLPVEKASLFIPPLVVILFAVRRFLIPAIVRRHPQHMG